MFLEHPATASAVAASTRKPRLTLCGALIGVPPSHEHITLASCAKVAPAEELKAMTRPITVAVTVLCFALTIALAVVGLRMWRTEQRKEAHIDWLMKKYGMVSYNCVAYDECTDAERKWMADCGKPSGNYSTPDPQADAVEDAYNKKFETKELEHRKQVFEDDLATGFGCASREDLEGMIAAINRELDRRKQPPGGASHPPAPTP